MDIQPAFWEKDSQYNDNAMFRRDNYARQEML